MESYKFMLNNLLELGEQRTDRTGTGTRSLFAQQWSHDMRLGFPLLTTKRVFWKGVVTEMLWFLRMRGDKPETWTTDYLHAYDVRIWDAWAQEFGLSGDKRYVGPIYGAQWRGFAPDGSGRGPVIDQLSEAIRQIKETPDSRRIVVTAWNPLAQSEMALPPCPTLFQLYVHMAAGSQPVGLSMHVYQRSADVFLGVPFDIAGYALLQHMIAKLTGLRPRRLTFSYGDLHLYDNHREQAVELLSRETKILPRLLLKDAESIDAFTHDHIILEGYDPHPAIKAEVAV